MDAADLVAGADLEGALQSLQASVRADPANLEHRVFLFQLQVLMGQWERALTQLDVCEDLSAAAIPMVQTYREAMRCEALRASVFAGERSPLVFGEPEQWIALMFEALRCTAQGQHVQAADLRARAFEDAPATPGSINGERFEWIADADERIGPLFEAIVDGKYYWIPFYRIAEVSVGQPEDLRDFVWAPAQFTWANGGQSVGLIPTRYPGTESAGDDRLRLARLTAWDEPSPDIFVGLGQRMFATDVNDYPLLETREIRLDVIAEADSGSEDG